MGLLGLFSRKRHERAGFALYTAAVRAARDPYYFTELAVPDTMDGRFDMIGLYTFLLIDRLHREADTGKALAQAVFDAMFLDMDHQLRELGIGDITVGRKNKAMWEALNGRRQAYEDAVAADDLEALTAAVGRNVWRGSPPEAAASMLARLMLAQHRHLETQGLDGLIAGRVDFLAAPAVDQGVSA
ncbi:MAG: ubiquinol-cytochrome C chaperone [Alphaproteobacteria bacterium]|nr:MAG: ubiquinol-cytochrome C chaperone [Alphaproteobacteria bacterium]